MALSHEPRGEVIISGDNPPTGQAHGWRGVIYGDGTLWRGSTHASRSLAYKTMVRANKDNDFKAVLKKPIPDDAE